MYKEMIDPSEKMKSLRNKINDPEGYLAVTPEYNRSTSSAIKNTLDYFLEEYYGAIPSCFTHILLKIYFNIISSVYAWMKGSLRLTVASAGELGLLTLDSLIEYITKGQNYPITFPRMFVEIIKQARINFESALKSYEGWYDFNLVQFTSSPEWLELSTEYHFY